MATTIPKLVASFALVPAMAAGQVCSGMGSFDERRWQGSVAGGLNADARSVGTALARGGRRPYGGVSITNAWVSRNNATAQSVTVGGGYQFGLDRAAVVQWCPYGSVEVTSGPRGVSAFGTVVDFSETSSAWGASVGLTTHRSPRLRIIPAGWVSFVHVVVRARDENALIDRRSVSFVSVGTGVGFVLRGKLTLRPGVSFPLELNNAPATMHLRVTYHFGLRE